MKFEEWGMTLKDFKEQKYPMPTPAPNEVYADWKAEREDWQEGIEGLKLSVSGLRIERGYLQAELAEEKDRYFKNEERWKVYVDQMESELSACKERIKDFEQELLRAADACEKAKSLLAGKEKI